MGNFMPDDFVTINSANNLNEYLSSFSGEAVTIFFDVDDTIITPKSALFSPLSEHKGLIDYLKEKRKTIENAEEKIGHWRVARQTILTDEGLPSLIEELKLSHNIYALTKLDSGKVGPIESMEEWRYNELKKHGVHFHTHFENGVFVESDENPAVHYNGIFITGVHLKSKVVEKYIDLHPSVSHIVLIDDKKEQLIDVQKVCALKQVKFTGIYYRAIDQRKDIPDEKIAEYQKKKLYEEGKWLEDEEAQKEMLGK